MFNKCFTLVDYFGRNCHIVFVNYVQTSIHPWMKLSITYLGSIFSSYEVKTGLTKVVEVLASNITKDLFSKLEAMLYVCLFDQLIPTTKYISRLMF